MYPAVYNIRNVPDLRFKGLGLMVQGVGFEFGVESLGFGVEDLGFSVQGLRSRV